MYVVYTPELCLQSVSENGTDIWKVTCTHFVLQFVVYLCNLQPQNNLHF